MAKLTQVFMQGAGAAPKDRVFSIYDDDLKGFVLRVRPSGVRSFLLRYRAPDGTERTMKIGDAAVLSPQQARAMAKQLLADVAQGGDPMGEKRAARAETLGEYLDGPWREHVLTKRRSAKSAEADHKRLAACFSDFWDVRLADLTGWQIEKWRSKRLKDGVSAGTLNVDRATLRSALADAVRMGLIASNPLASLRPLKNPAADGRVRYLEPDERKKLEAALLARDEDLRAARDRHNQWLIERHHAPAQNLRECAFADYLRPMFEVSVNTGIRRGELFSLKWADVDLERRLLTVRADTAKAGKTRRIPLNDAALSALSGWRAQTDGKDLVFPSPQTGGRLDNIRSAWRRVLKMAGLEDFRWHDLRHEFASRLVMRGVDLNVVRTLLGHADLKMTLRYAHLAPEHTAEAVGRIDGWGVDNVVAFEANGQRGE